MCFVPDVFSRNALQVTGVDPTDVSALPPSVLADHGEHGGSSSRPPRESHVAARWVNRAGTADGTSVGPSVGVSESTQASSLRAPPSRIVRSSAAAPLDNVQPAAPSQPILRILKSRFNGNAPRGPVSSGCGRAAWAKLVLRRERREFSGKLPEGILCVTFSVEAVNAEVDSRTGAGHQDHGDQDETGSNIRNTDWDVLIRSSGPRERVC
ncbi:hypothetical protein EYF80_009913 [Liparis tanakae]|uniref:Uncharacterized protein n=1 Tax=Liparis tanakae TaxID=230148 RepID=A0A4Z2IPS9_9TELE|nr:hypothetical protein EYF80_009913 [Liparis tanakae]